MTRTVRCSYCHVKGHNRRNCDLMAAHAKEDPNSYAGLCMKKMNEKKKVSTRRCSYCRETGHTKRTCPQRQEDIRVLDTNNVVFRHKMLASMRKQGIGPGALLRVLDGSVSHGVQKGDLLLITEMRWNNLNLDNCSWSYKTNDDNDISYSMMNQLQHHAFTSTYQRHMKCMILGTDRFLNLYLPQQHDNTTELLNYSSREDLEVVSSCRPTPPDDWTSHQKWAHKVMI